MHKIAKVFYSTNHEGVEIVTVIAMDEHEHGYSFEGTDNNVIPVLIHMHTQLDLVTYSWADLIRAGAREDTHRECRDIFSDVRIHAENDMLVSAYVADGDTAAMLHGEGVNTIAAIADLLRNQDYRGGMSPQEFVAELAYGRERRSNEVLAAELEGVFTPSAGAW